MQELITLINTPDLKVYFNNEIKKYTVHIKNPDKVIAKVEEPKAEDEDKTKEH